MYVWPCHQLVVAFIRHEARAEYPLIHLSVLARPNIAVAALLIFIYPGFGTTAASFVLPDYLTRVQGLRALGKAQRSTVVIGGRFPPKPFLKDAPPEVRFGSKKEIRTGALPGLSLAPGRRRAIFCTCSGLLSSY